MPRYDEITSEELDGLLDEAETLHVAHAAYGTEVRLYVAVDPDTLHELEQTWPRSEPTWRLPPSGRPACRRSAGPPRTPWKVPSQPGV